MNEEILEFINRRFGNYELEDCFCYHNCYWFAKILCERFPFLKIYYEPIVGHFYAGTPSHYYDLHGLSIPYSRPILLDQIKKEEPNWYSRLVEDCIL